MQKQFPKIDTYNTGQNIKQIMVKQGMTVKDVQEYLGLAAPQSIYHWFDGKSLPTMDNLYALSQLFHMPIDMIVCGNRKEYFCVYEYLGHWRIRIYYEKCLELRAG